MRNYYGRSAVQQREPLGRIVRYIESTKCDECLLAWPQLKRHVAVRRVRNSWIGQTRIARVGIYYGIDDVRLDDNLGLGHQGASWRAIGIRAHCGGLISLGDDHLQAMPRILSCQRNMIRSRSIASISDGVGGVRNGLVRKVGVGRIRI